jgi:23S rRNA pseudouridine2605 synthase
VVMESVRINKYIADSGFCSRRNADTLVSEGRVQLNGTIVMALGTKVQPGKDRVEVDGKIIDTSSKRMVLAFNKPQGVLCSMKDPFGRPTISEFMKDIPQRLYHVGRLDYDTSGLILLTNDGEIAQKVMHPKKMTPKTYIAKVKGIPKNSDLEKFQTGLEIEDYKTSPAKIKMLKRLQDSCLLQITIHEGRNRQIRKMCEKIGHPVLDLQRISIGKINLGTLKEGVYRILNEDELKYLNDL